VLVPAVANSIDVIGALAGDGAWQRKSDPTNHGYASYCNDVSGPVLVVGPQSMYVRLVGIEKYVNMPSQVSNAGVVASVL
jgi:hypothetical protein